MVCVLHLNKAILKRKKNKEMVLGNGIFNNRSSILSIDSILDVELCIC